MKVLLVGGSGIVGNLVLPYLKQHHEIRILDPLTPGDRSVEHLQGSVNSVDDIRRAVQGMDAVVYMVLGRNPDGTAAIKDIDAAYDLNVKGLHRVLQGTVDAKINRLVYTSTLSVHNLRTRVFESEDTTPCDSNDVYGLTKWLGEMVCAHFARVHGLSVTALRLTGPLPVERWRQSFRPGRTNIYTAAPDVASSIDLALTAAYTGFHPLFISGDYEGKIVNCARAKALLGWEPLSRPEPVPPAAASLAPQ